MDDEKDKRPDGDWEAVKLYFEFFKHFTTLTTAVGLIVIALFRELDLSTTSAVAGLGSLGITLFLSLSGMLLMVARAQGEFAHWVRPSLAPFLLACLTISFFFLSLLLFVIQARGVPPSGSILF